MLTMRSSSALALAFALTASPEAAEAFGLRPPVLSSSPSLSRAGVARAGSRGVKMVATAPTSKFEKMRFKYGKPSLERGISQEMKDAQKIAGFDYSDFESAIAKFDNTFQVGDVVVGQVVQFEQGGALVDIGGKSSAYLGAAEASMQRVDDIEMFLSIADNREFQIISGEDENGQVRLSIRKLEFARAWERVRQIQAEDCTIMAEILSINRGGALINFEGLRGFLPGSHAPQGMTEDTVGTMIPLKFLEVDQAKNRLVVSNRRAVVETKLVNLEPGQLVTGIVRSIKPYGAFVDIGGISGLLHISQISHDHISDVSKVLQEGQEIKAMILTQDKDKGRFSLSTKTLEAEPGDMIRNPEMVKENAEETAKRYHERLQAEQQARDQAASELVAGLDLNALSSEELVA
ncbi:ribosomal protein S1, chloroplastic [Guillardia theta CCMP2712]|uniref:Ribosomal protein S1, chloroplastic n=1 Tax=Guillardia theta (strain CCMP2712) TaxID=905079 RepID=L1IVV6_GUITC|nr:ribosomal protein S1, chloroplastic [Guillardia theta CCMP2712]EKX40024.1 ribosomal protein S1, chloroplastic [Guillardia theta CCMP2712]|eukprot:XP_005827004.1 ribosomal protein S1, chloroplastic [Guillardia theta CCMP2712]